MTLIAAQLEADGTVHVVGDRATRVGGSYSIVAASPKIHGWPDVIVGAAGHSHWCAAVASWAPPPRPPELAGAGYLRCLARHVAAIAPAGAVCELLLATRGAILCCHVTEHRDLAPWESVDGIGAIGSAALPARAALAALGTSQNAPFRLVHVAGVVAALMPGDVRGPFDVLAIPANASSTSASVTPEGGA